MTEFPYTTEERELLASCTLCPRHCAVDRFSSNLGYCNTDANFRISSVCSHNGEEPVISGEKGICNIFFSRCNLQCKFCQNYQISRNDNTVKELTMTYEQLINRICKVLDSTENIIGFVSPSHQVAQLLAIVRGLHEAGRYPIIVYNTNAYDSVETLKRLEGIVDIYLPDFKYIDSHLSNIYSDSKDYPEFAKKALKEMFRQKGSTLITDERGIAMSGIIIRHLVLPGNVQQSIDALWFIASEVSPDLHVSLMSQYFPTFQVTDDKKLQRTLTEEEYQSICNAFYESGLHRGWIQEMGSHAGYRPDFSKDIPFDR